MKIAEVYTKNQIAKLGNTIVYIIDYIYKWTGIKLIITKTHVLSLIFIIEELSIRKFGIPFFDLRFDVWKIGPISKDLFVELSDEPNLLSEYISKECKGNNSYFTPTKLFSDDEFSDNELQFLEEICSKFKYIVAVSFLEGYMRRKNSLWYNTAVRNGVLELLESSKITTTDIPIDMSELVKDDKDKLALYLSHKEFMKQSKSLKF